MDETINTIVTEVNQFLVLPNAMRSLVILLLSILLAFLVSRLLARGIIRIAQFVAVQSDEASNDERQVRLRQVETYLSVTVAIVRVLVVVIIGYMTWRILSPQSSASAAAIGTSAIIVIIASGIIGPLLRDITAGATMIIEQWFRVGDFVRIDPFGELGGVVEKITLRSTKLRSLNGETVWIHNQHIQGVRVTPHGLRTIEVDVFVRNPEAGRLLVDRVTGTIPTGTMTVVEKVKIVREEQWGERLWLLTVRGKTPPGREWLIENYFVESLKELDDANDNQIMARIPIVRYSDPSAERSFRRAVRTAREK